MYTKVSKNLYTTCEQLAVSPIFYVQDGPKSKPQPNDQKS